MALDGDQVACFAEDLRPTAAVLDLRMPDLDAAEAIRLSNTKPADTPVIALTAD
jgi:DNA-binding response OmpR family regulator